MGHSFELIGVLCETSDTSSCSVADRSFYRQQRQASSLYSTRLELSLLRQRQQIAKVYTSSRRRGHAG